MEMHSTPVELSEEQLAVVFGGQEESDQACPEANMESEYAL